MNIRLLDEDEVLDGINLVKEVFFQENNLSASREGARSFLKLLDEKGSTFKWLGAYEKALEGVIAWDEERMHVVWLFVRRESRRRRIGTFLVQEAAKIAFLEGFDRLTLNGTDNAMDFYRFNGFELLEDRQEYGLNLHYMELRLCDRFLGTEVTVTIEHTIGELHGLYADEQYPCNCGYIEELAVHSGIFQDAYVIGPQEPLDRFHGFVAGIIYRYGGGCAWIVSGSLACDRQLAIDTVAFREQYDETRIVWYDEQVQGVS